MQKEVIMATGAGMGFLSSLISLGLTIWFVAFTVMVLKKLDKINESLNKKD